MKKWDRIMKVLSWLMIGFGIAAIVFFAVLTACGEDMSRYSGAALLGGCLILTGILGLRGWKK